MPFSEYLVSAYSPGFLASSLGNCQPFPNFAIELKQNHEEPVKPIKLFNADLGTFAAKDLQPKQIYRSDLFILRNAVIYPDGILACDNRLILESFRPSSIFLKDLPFDDATVYPCTEVLSPSFLDSLLQVKTVQLPADSMYALAYSPFAYNFGHWHGETLSALGALRAVHPETKLLFPVLKTWQRDSLASLGINESRIIEHSPNEAVAVPFLIVSSSIFVYKRDNYRAPISYIRLASDIRNNSLSNCLLSSCNGASRVYLSRIGDSSRRIINEEDVIDVFRARGFQSIRAEELSYNESIAIVSRADVIAGPSGSAMTRGLFMHPEATYIQLSVPGGWHEGFHFNASVAGVANSYAYIEDEANITYRQDLSPYVQKVNQITHWKIDLSSLASFLDACLSDT